MRKAFTINNNKGFTLRFNNGTCLSVQFGIGNYCENRYLPMKNYGEEMKSDNVEIAIFNEKEEWLTKKFFKDLNDDVNGYLNINEVTDLIKKVKEYDDGVKK